MFNSSSAPFHSFKFTVISEKEKKKSLIDHFTQKTYLFPHHCLQPCCFDFFFFGTNLLRKPAADAGV